MFFVYYCTSQHLLTESNMKFNHQNYQLTELMLFRKSHTCLLFSKIFFLPNATRTTSCHSMKQFCFYFFIVSYIKVLYNLKAWTLNLLSSHILVNIFDELQHAFVAPTKHSSDIWFSLLLSFYLTLFWQFSYRILFQVCGSSISRSSRLNLEPALPLVLLLLWWQCFH